MRWYACVWACMGFYDAAASIMHFSLTKRETQVCASSIVATLSFVLSEAIQYSYEYFTHRVLAGTVRPHMSISDPLYMVPQVPTAY